MSKGDRTGRRREVPFGFFMLDVSLPSLRKHRAAHAAECIQNATQSAEVLAIFRRFDVDGDGMLNSNEMEAAAVAVCPGERWDPALWTEFCMQFEADPRCGFNSEAFERFHATIRSASPTAAPTRQSRAELPQLDWPDDWPATEVRLATTAFIEYDVDGDSFLNLDEMRAFVESEHPMEVWDDDDWKPMCEHLGVAPDSGLSFEAFLRFRLSVVESEAQQAWENAVVTRDDSPMEFMSEAQLKVWALGATSVAGQVAKNESALQWDEALWPQLCESYGADPSLGFSWEHFMQLFRTHQAVIEAQEQLDMAKLAAVQLKSKSERDTFLRYDVDGDGYLNLQEMGVAALQVFDTMH